MTSISAPPTSSSYATSLSAQSDYRVSPVHSPPIPSSPAPSSTQLGAPIPTSSSSAINGSGSGSSRWKNVFKIGKNGTLPKSSNSSRPSVLPLDGKENTLPSSYSQVDEMGRQMPYQTSAVSSPNPSLKSHELYSPPISSVSRATSGKSGKSGKSSNSKSKKARGNEEQNYPVPLSGSDTAARLEVDDADGDDGSGSFPPSRPESQIHAALTPSGDLSHSYAHTQHQGSTSGEQQRPFSSVTTDTSRSSRSSGSRQLASHSPNQVTGMSSASIGISGSSAGAGAAAAAASGGATTPLRPALGLTGFKSRFFSSSNVVDASSSNSKSVSKDRGKEDRYQGLGKEATVKPSRKKSVGSNGSSNHLQSPQLQTSTSSPRTPSKDRSQGTPQSNGQDADTEPKSGSTTPSRSAAARFLRRVVSAPNTKAFLLGNNTSDVPPLPTAPIKSHANTIPIPGQSPIVVLDQDSPTQEVDLSISPTNLNLPTGTSSTFLSSLSPHPFSALSSSTASLPHRSAASGHLSPHTAPRGGVSATGTRAARAHTASGAGASRKDLQAVLGVADGKSPESHHKAVFKRTYSSNSIKTRSVSDGVSSERQPTSI